MFTEDLSAFFDTRDFAVAALYQAGGLGAGVEVDVISDNSFLLAAGIASTTAPGALAKQADFTGWSTADLLTINAVAYKIIDAQPQDDGQTVLLQLQKQ